MNGLGRWLLPIATAVGAWGGFPKAPKVWRDYAENSELFQYATVFILIWQGGSQQNFRVAVITTVLIYLFAKLARMREIVSDMEQPTHIPQPPTKLRVIPETETSPQPEEVVEGYY